MLGFGYPDWLISSCRGKLKKSINSVNFVFYPLREDNYVD
jgi:hypothetical protein